MYKNIGPVFPHGQFAKPPPSPAQQMLHQKLTQQTMQNNNSKHVTCSPKRKKCWLTGKRSILVKIYTCAWVSLCM